MLKIGPRIRIELIFEEEPGERVVVKDAKGLWKLLRDEVRTWDRERFLVLCLDNQNGVIGVDPVAVGASSVTNVLRRDVLKSVILSNAAAFVCIHNHPEGSPEPLENDKELTAQILELSMLLGIPMMDHVIFGASGYYSFTEEGMKKRREGH